MSSEFEYAAEDDLTPRTIQASAATEPSVTYGPWEPWRREEEPSGRWWYRRKVHGVAPGGELTGEYDDVADSDNDIDLSESEIEAMEAEVAERIQAAKDRLASLQAEAGDADEFID